jgi:6-phosphofructokinase 1
MGIPKTIDNDLFGTDHCPGFPSAAKYIATACAEVYEDARVYDTGMITIIEIMGRNAGWLAASSKLACVGGNAPDLIYLPEINFDMDTFLNDVEALYKSKGSVIVAVSEGIKDKDGKYISEYGSSLASQKDQFGHSQMGGLAQTLVSFVKARTGAKMRGIELSLLQRCAAHSASLTDVNEAYLAGQTAVEQAVAGVTDKMVAFERVSQNPYKCGIKLIDLSDVANYEKKVPREWINEAGNGINQAFIDYALPLVQGEPDIKRINGLPRFPKLKKIIAK